MSICRRTAPLSEAEEDLATLRLIGLIEVGVEVVPRRRWDATAHNKWASGSGRYRRPSMQPAQWDCLRSTGIAVRGI